MSWVKLTQFSVESSYVKLKIWATRLKLSWKCEQLDSISIQVQNVNSKLNLMISLSRWAVCDSTDSELHVIVSEVKVDLIVVRLNDWFDKFE